MGRATSTLFRDHPEIEVWAAGGGVWRPASAGIELLLVHRPHHDDWTYPKGKLDEGETLRRCALREVEEETGLRCTTHDRLSLVTYRDARRRRKAVVYWTMTVDEGSFVPNAEVDAVAWFDTESARAVLTYAHDADLVAEITATIESPTVSP